MTSRDKIESSSDPLAEFLTTKGSTQVVDINASVSPAVLAGILKVNVSLIYQFRQEGKLPPNSDASLKDCIKWHITFWKSKSVSKTTDIGQAALLQKMKLDIAKTEQAWLGIKREKGELIDIDVLAEKFEVHFLHMRGQLISLTKKHPDLENEIDKILIEWSTLGKNLMKKSQQELDNFIEESLNEEPDLKVSEDLE